MPESVNTPIEAPSSSRKIPRPRRPHKRTRFLLTGLLTVIPLWATWFVLVFLFKLLSGVGGPAVKFIANLVAPHFPGLAHVLKSEVFQSVVAVILVLAVLYTLGILATLVIGRQLFAVFEAIIERIPFVKTIYGAVKKLLGALKDKPSSDVQRVVLIDFPSPEMKTVGLVTRTLTDADTGRELAAVYVPTTPNPTSGYLEIVPIERVTSTNWTLDEAMTFVISGGAVAPAHMNYDKSAPPASESETE